MTCKINVQLSTLLQVLKEVGHDYHELLDT